MHKLYTLGGSGLVRIDEPANGKKNNLPIGTVLKLNGYSNPRYVIVRNRGISESFSAYGATYETVSLEDYSTSQSEGALLMFLSEKKDNRIQMYITDEVLTGEEVLDAVERSKAAKLSVEAQKEAAAKVRTDNLAKLRALDNGLVQLTDTYKDSLGAASKNIKKELARAFPGVKFSVRSERYSGGDAVRIHWTDGPTTKQVDAIADKYQGGSFDGMTDSYTYSHSEWCAVFGDAKYITTSRHLSGDLLRRVVAELGAAVTIKEENGHAWVDRTGNYDEADRVNRKAYETEAK